MSTFDICEERCDQCLFSGDKVVGGARRAEILQDCARQDVHFICHKFTIAAMAGEPVSDQTCCRGFYDTGRPSQLMRIAQALGVVRFVPIPETSAPDNRHAEGRQIADDPTDDAEVTGSGQGRDSAAVSSLRGTA